MKERIVWVDSAKGIGILLVFLGHLVEMSWPGMWAYSFHLPLFFFLSGFLFSAKASFFDFMRKKIKSLMVPYVSLGIIICFFAALWDSLFPKTITGQPFGTLFLTNIIYMIIQKRFATLWYLAVLFWVNILMYVLVKYVKKMWVMGVIALVFLNLGYWYYNRGGGALPWNPDTAFMALIFFYGGYVFRHIEKLQKPLLSGTVKSGMLGQCY